jgi:hypothetical protein
MVVCLPTEGGNSGKLGGWKLEGKRGEGGSAGKKSERMGSWV